MQSKNPSVIALSTASAVSVTGLAFISPVILLLKNSYQISSNEVQLTITIYLMAICISQIFWGPLSDIIGRRKVLIFGAALFSLGGILASLNLAFEIFIFFRFLQGIGAAACLSMPRVMLTESYGAEEASGKMSTLLAFIAIFPILSAAFGGLIGEIYGWQTNFVTLFAFGFIVFLLNYTYSPETIRCKSKKLTVKTTFSISQIHRSYCSSRILTLSFLRWSILRSDRSRRRRSPFICLIRPGYLIGGHGPCGFSWFRMMAGISCSLPFPFWLWPAIISRFLSRFRIYSNYQ